MKAILDFPSQSGANDIGLTWNENDPDNPTYGGDNRISELSATYGFYEETNRTDIFEVIFALKFTTSLETVQGVILQGSAKLDATASSGPSGHFLVNTSGTFVSPEPPDELEMLKDESTGSGDEPR